MQSLLPPILITLILIALSLDLPKAWGNSPYDHFGAYAFLLWIAAPLILKRIGAPKSHWPHICAAILAAVGWVLGEFNFILYAALSLAFFGWMRSGTGPAFWLLASLSWMPIFGYAMANLGINPQLANLLRLTLALIGSLALLYNPHAANPEKTSTI